MFGSNILGCLFSCRRVVILDPDLFITLLFGTSFVHPLYISSLLKMLQLFPYSKTIGISFFVLLRGLLENVLPAFLYCSPLPMEGLKYWYSLISVSLSCCFRLSLSLSKVGDVKIEVIGKFCQEHSSYFLLPTYLKNCRTH